LQERRKSQQELDLDPTAISIRQETYLLVLIHTWMESKCPSFCCCSLACLLHSDNVMIAATACAIGASAAMFYAKKTVPRVRRPPLERMALAST
jgi:hypothetical protein